jgi:hypothetical protein
LTTSILSTTSLKATYEKRQKTVNKNINEFRHHTYLPLSHEVRVVVINECELLTFGPLLAIDKTPGFEC